ncbi:MAG TPA: hypothetical protein VMU09_10085 [Acidimicrobiales bacterium]|nr:hypothetical protein [Acidimicrobiales bacterium]
MGSPAVAIVSFRLGGSDGVSVEAAKWAWALGQLGFRTLTVAGDGPVDHVLPGLAIGAPSPPTAAELERTLAGADLVVVENLCSLPLNPGAWDVVARCLAGRPALLHHHDLPWQREQFAAFPPPPDDVTWAHVATSRFSAGQLADRGIDAAVVYNAFDTAAVPGERDRTRAALGVGPAERLVVQPTRAIARKNVAVGLALARAAGATFWLLGPAEDGYGPELELVLAGAGTTRVLRGHGAGHGDGRPFAMADVYAAADAVALPSTWEGFGNPTVESAVHHRPLAVGRYPVADELAAFGFRWLAADDPGAFAAAMDEPDPADTDRNFAVADRHFALRDLPERLGKVLAGAGWHRW